MHPQKLLVALPILSLIIFVSACHKKVANSPKNPTAIEHISLIVDDQRNVKDAVMDLIRLSGLNATSAALSDAITLTQAHWLRPQRSERVHLFESHQSSLPLMMKDFDSLGLRSAYLPHKNNYHYVILLGAMFDTFKQRLDYLETLVLKGLRFDKLVLLGSYRPLEKSYETGPLLNTYTFSKMPLTEIDMMQELVEQSSLKDIDAKNIISVASAMKVGSDGSVKRANTLDTFRDFLELKPVPGDALIISNQPYILRQGLVAESILLPPWNIETVGPAVLKALPTDVYLDELARTLYEINNYLSFERKF